jgi:hypothetical protein
MRYVAAVGRGTVKLLVVVVCAVGLYFVGAIVFALAQWLGADVPLSTFAGFGAAIGVVGLANMDAAKKTKWWENIKFGALVFVMVALSVIFLLFVVVGGFSLYSASPLYLLLAVVIILLWGILQQLTKLANRGQQ